MDNQHETGGVTDRWVLRRLQVAIGVSCGKVGTATDVQIDSHWFPFLVINEVNFGKADDDRLSVA